LFKGQEKPDPSAINTRLLPIHHLFNVKTKENAWQDAGYQCVGRFERGADRKPKFEVVPGSDSR
jgi:hypothetical protein